MHSNNYYNKSNNVQEHSIRKYASVVLFYSKAETKARQCSSKKPEFSTKRSLNKVLCQS